ncbi:hypothetical protein CDFC105_30355 [Clostridioides difficile]|nr:hypothetical protein CDFC105_30355 [Clostridioides difficile]
MCVFFLMARRPQRSTRKESSAASDVYKRQKLFKVTSLVSREIEKEEFAWKEDFLTRVYPTVRLGTVDSGCLLYTSPSPRDS